MLLKLEENELLTQKTWTDGAKAAKLAQYLTKRTGHKFQIRKIDPDAGDKNWRERELARFETAEYTHVTSFIRSMSPPDTFPHVAKKNPALIAYTKDEYKGREDKQSLLTIEAFIDMCLAYNRKNDEQLASRQGFDSVEQMHARRWGSDWKRIVSENQLRMAVEANSPVTFIGPVADPANDDEVCRIAKEIEDAYVNYDGRISALEASCMRYPASNFRLPDGVHPTAIYASPDVALAVIRNKEGKTTARALCWPERKIYTRVYADSNALDNALKALGYERAGYYGVSTSGKRFRGARLRKIEISDDEYVAPYIDGNHAVDVGDEWLTMEGDEMECDRTDGRAHYHDGMDTCPHCGERCSEDDMTHVYLDSTHNHSEYWCSHCAESDAVYCNGSNHYYHSMRVDFVEIGGEMYTQRYADRYANYCERTEEYTFDSIVPVIVDDYGNHQNWADWQAHEHAFQWDGRWYSKDDVTYELVVTRRYVQHIQSRRITGTYRYQTTNVWYNDETVGVPQMAIDDGDVDVYQGPDDRWYMRDYVDLYPVERERVPDVNFVPKCWAFQYLAIPQPTASFGERMAELRALRKMVEEMQELSKPERAPTAEEMILSLEELLQG